MGNRKAIIALLIIVIGAIAIGMLAGRCNGNGDRKGEARVDSGVVALKLDPPAHDAGPIVIVDAGDLVVDAGIALTALPPITDELPVKLPSVKSTKRTDKPSAAPPKEPKRETVDAGTTIAKVEAPVVDAGAPLVDADADAGAAPAVAAAKPPPAAPVTEGPRSPFALTFEDGLQEILRLVQLEIYVDGKRVVQQKNEDGLKIEGAALLHHGSLFPGTHQVRVELVYTGKPGLFSYMEAYKFRLRPMTLVHVSADKPVRVKALAYDRGAQYAFESRPDVKYVVE